MGQQAGWVAGESAFPAVWPLLGLCFDWSNETPPLLAQIHSFYFHSSLCCFTDLWLWWGRQTINNG